MFANIGNLELSTNDEKGFIERLKTLGAIKLIFGRVSSFDNHIKPIFEIRIMPTAGGYQFGMAEINSMNQRHSGIYTFDVEEAYLRCIDIERSSPSCSWFEVEDCEHTVDTVY